MDGTRAGAMTTAATTADSAFPSARGVAVTNEKYSFEVVVVGFPLTVVVIAIELRKFVSLAVKL